VRTVYIGTTDFAADVLAQSGLRPELVVTRPPARRGRGRHLSATPVAQRASELGFALAEPDRLEQVAGRVGELDPELVVLCAYGALVREPFLSSHEILNVHPSLLPRWRGAAPIERAIMAGDVRTGVSLMRLVAELDAGPVCSARSVPIEPGDDHGTLSATLSALAAAMLAEAIGGPREYVAQDDGAATYAAKLTSADRALQPALPAAVLERTVRALRPHIGARLPDGLAVLAARVAERATAPGALESQDGRLYYGATPGSLELLEVRPAGGRAMDAASYLRGHAV